MMGVGVPEGGRHGRDFLRPRRKTPAGRHPPARKRLKSQGRWESVLKDEANGRILNIGANKEITILDLAKLAN